MNRIMSLNKINVIEFIRTKKAIFCSCFLLVITGLNLIIAASFNFISKNVDLSNYQIIKNFLDSINEAIPSSVKDYSSLYCSQIITLYSFLCVLIFSRIVPDEINKGKWIIPTNYDYKKSQIIISKSVIYALLACLPIIPLFYIYNFSLQFFFGEDSYAFLELLGRSLLLFFDEFCIISLSVALSSKKQYIIFLLSMFAYFTILPDMLSLLSFKYFLPTFVFSYLYSNETFGWLLFVPILENLIIYVLIFILCIIDSSKININER